MTTHQGIMPPCATCGHSWAVHIIPGGVENIDIYPHARWCDECGCRNYTEASVGAMTAGWCVRVTVFDDLVVSISERELAGRDISESDADLIRDCAQHLLSFVGEQKPVPTQETGQPPSRCVAVDPVDGEGTKGLRAQILDLQTQLITQAAHLERVHQENEELKKKILARVDTTDGPRILLPQPPTGDR